MIYKTLSKVSTIVNSKDIDNIPFFRSYTFSSDETKLLLITASTPIYRHSQLGTYYVYDTKTKKATLVATNKIQEPTFSSDGSKVAYVYNNNIFYYL